MFFTDILVHNVCGFRQTKSADPKLKEHALGEICFMKFVCVIFPFYEIHQ